MNPIVNLIQSARVYIWDFGLVVVNTFTPNLKEGEIVPQGCPGHKGNWPEYQPPKEGDSRSACPALNALANHGILPRDGKNIPFTEMSRVVNESYNFAPSFCFFVPNYSANFLKRDYNKDTFNLEELSQHNAIEHDASLTREDVHFNQDQSKPHLPFVEELLSYATGKDSEGHALLTADDIARYSAKRRADSQANNPEFTLETIHKFFGSSNNSTMLRIFGGRVDHLRTMLTEEKIPEGWQSSCLARKGLTMASFNRTAMGVETSTKVYLAKKE
ncbi:Cloroperoxidase [Marasmius fiardii PR-910]|nr:Cloroperoxidase [Marasmius fiardii PR-910]